MVSPRDMVETQLIKGVELIMNTEFLLKPAIKARRDTRYPFSHHRITPRESPETRRGAGAH